MIQHERAVNLISQARRHPGRRATSFPSSSARAASSGASLPVWNQISGAAADAILSP